MKPSSDSTTVRRRPTRLALTMLLTAGLLGGSAAVAAPALAQPGCAVAQAGSLPKEAPDASPAIIANVRAGWDGCADRLVIDLAGPPDGYLVSYVDMVHREGSGEPVPVRGGATLQVVARSPVYDPYTGHRLWVPADPNEVLDVRWHPTFRQVAYAGSFEGQTTFALGVRARLPFQVFTLAGSGPGGSGEGSRLVIDVAHVW